ncbi:Cytolysin/lectin [Kalaharituber pfeilii]|nr:Cytolysin/lectin [Kalaharituber pfeilii]
MTYTITVRIHQTNQDAFFQVVEKAVWHYGGGCSGNSGVLRFVSDTGEHFIVALGVCNYKCWADIVTGLTPEQTSVVILPQYYGSERSYVREKQLSAYTVYSAQQWEVSVTYTVAY